MKDHPILGSIASDNSLGRAVAEEIAANSGCSIPASLAAINARGLELDAEPRNDDVGELVTAAQNYFTRYCLDEADEGFCDGDRCGVATGCSREQAADAIRLRDALRPFRARSTATGEAG